MDAHVGAGDTPGPGEYDAARPSRGAGRRAGEAMGGDAAPVPGDGVPVPGPRRVRGGRRRGPGGDAPAFTMYARVPDLAGERMAAGTPGPGAYDVARRAAGAAQPRGRVRAAAVTRADARRREQGGFGPPAPRGSTRRTRGVASAAPSRVLTRPHRRTPWPRVPRARRRRPRRRPLGRRTTRTRTRTRRRRRSDPAQSPRAVGPARRKGATFGARPAHGGALSHLGESASKPGPGQCHDMHSAVGGARPRAGAVLDHPREVGRARPLEIRRRPTRRGGSSTTASTAKTTWRFSPASAAA